MTPPQVFAVISLLLIAGVMVATSLTQSSFFRQAIINREAILVRDVVSAVVFEELLEQELSSSDLERYDEPAAQERLEHSFRGLKNLSGVLRIKVFGPDMTIVWSDQPHLIGTKSTSHKEDLASAMNGEVRAVFNPAERTFNDAEGLPHIPLIEFYVPLSIGKPGTPRHTDSSAVALYRSPQELNDTIHHGLLLLWLVTGLGGAILFTSLYKLFHSVYHRQRKAESQFAKLSTEHERIMQIEKLSAMGQMVSEIAHQLNNPLVGVVNLTELAERELGNPRRVRELLGEVRKAGNDCRSFVQRMLLINKVARFEPQLTDMNRLVRETITFFQQSLGGHPTVTLEAPPQQVTLEVDPVLIRNALFNLIHNAAQAEPIGPVVVSLALDERNGMSGCRLTVSDSGSGLTRAVAAKLFTPFFTTRPGGTGLGLSIARHIVVQHGGSIHAENKPGGGARFIIWLPVKKANA
jgi:signal transduction histidine kinase